MINIVENFLSIQRNILDQNLQKKPEIIAVSKTFSLDHIKPLLDHGHRHFGENKVQEATKKWTQVMTEIKDIKLHMVGSLQSNKAKDAVRVFSYIHSLDSEKLANSLKKAELKFNKKLQYFIQVNIGEEKQKSGISINELDDFYSFCKNETKLNIIGLMVLPPNDKNTEIYFKRISEKNKLLNLPELSMGMTADYDLAIKHYSTYLRIGSAIFGERNIK